MPPINRRRVPWANSFARAQLVASTGTLSANTIQRACPTAYIITHRSGHDSPTDREPGSRGPLVDVFPTTGSGGTRFHPGHIERCNRSTRTLRAMITTRASVEQELRRVVSTCGCITKLGGMPTAVRVGMFDQAIRIRAARRLLIAQYARATEQEMHPQWVGSPDHEYAGSVVRRTSSTGRPIVKW